jgi:hypothetical protein
MNKTLIALSAVALSVPFAARSYEAEQDWRPLPSSNRPTRRPPLDGWWYCDAAKLVQYGEEAPENMLGDRYQPITVYQPIATKVVGRPVKS